MDAKAVRIILAAQQLFFRHGIKKVGMSDIASAADLSRPSLYGVFKNKEAVLEGLLEHHIEINHAETLKRMASKKSLQEKLQCLFDVWIVEPFASAIDTDGGKELMREISNYAPELVDQVYVEFEKLAASALTAAMGKRSALSAKDVAHILALGTRGVKTTSDSVPELKRLVKGLLVMTISFVEKA